MHMQGKYKWKVIIWTWFSKGLQPNSRFIYPTLRTRKKTENFTTLINFALFHGVRLMKLHRLELCSSVILLIFTDHSNWKLSPSFPFSISIHLGGFLYLMLLFSFLSFSWIPNLSVFFSSYRVSLSDFTVIERTKDVTYLKES